MVSKLPHDTRKARDAQALRSQLDEDVETYLTLGDKLAGLKKAQTEIRKKKILPTVEKLGLEVGQFFAGVVDASVTHPIVRMWREFKHRLIAEDVGVNEGSDVVLELEEFISELEPYEDEETRQWSLTKFPGSKRLDTSEFKRHLIEAGVAPKVVKAAEAKATKPGKPTVKIQWRSSQETEEKDNEE